MSIPAIIIMNIGAAVLLVTILTALMLTPTRLRHPLAGRRSSHQEAALRAKRRARAKQHPHRHVDREPIWRPVEDL